MKRRWLAIGAIALVALLLAAGGAAGDGPAAGEATVNSRISYQGVLKESGVPVSGTRNMVFRLHSNATCTSQVGGDLVHNNVPVSDGLFSVSLDVDQSLLNGQGLWLQLLVGGTDIVCREVQAVPYALGLRPGATVAGTVPAGSVLTVVNNDTGATGFGIKGETASSNGRGVYGYATAASGANYGVFGQSMSTGGRGVYGLASATSGTTYGMYGRAISTAGTAVYGHASASSGTTYGVYGRSDSASGYGGYFYGPGVGAYGRATGTAGQAVVGYASSASGTTYGVVGQSHSSAGRGVYGLADAASGTTYGVYGESDSPNSYGVFGTAPKWGVTGSATATTGATYGVYGASASTEGTGVAGWASTTTGTTCGVAGQSRSFAGIGVYGVVSAGYGTNYGVMGESSSSDGRGVYGLAPAASGTTYGVYGESESTAGRGVYGFADASSGTTYGVYGETDSTAGHGVYGLADATSGTAYGVTGHSTSFFGVYAWGNDSSAYDTRGDLLLEGSRGEIFAAGDLLDLYSNGNVVVDLDNDNNTANACFRVLDGSDGILWSVCEPAGVVAAGRQASSATTDDYGERLVYGVEGTGVWIEDVGTADLVKGEATVAFEPVFAQMVNLARPYQVFVTALSDEPVWLYVSDKSAAGFTVRGVTLDGRPAECVFDYRVMAERLGYEEVRLESYAPAGEGGVK